MSDRSTAAANDRSARDQALDIGRSFIVQAPAGSGKTELLIQRYLKLLATVGTPEQVLAITFTRKAAGEMRDRVVRSLEEAEGAAPQESHKRLTWELAREALAQDRAMGWRLQDRPGRLAIMTIDSLSSQLARRVAIPAQFPGSAGISERPGALYEQAALRVLSGLGPGEPADEQVETLLRHLDNNVALAQGLLADMLARRDHWLRHVMSTRGRPGGRQILEEAIARAVAERLQPLHQALTGELGERLVGIARRAAALAPESAPLIRACATLAALPGPAAGELQAWQGLAELCLTRQGTLRKRLTVGEGFPASEPGLKAAMSEALEQLAGLEGIETALDAVRRLPPSRYSDEQWAVLDALLELLRQAVAQLDVLFAEVDETDYAAVSMAADRALGEEQAPTDLALYLDYRLQHILVDEFQDTSHGQYHLLRKLTAGWQPGDGRTLFCVGDPMQSIYRFREAEVGYYLDARSRGLGNIRLQALYLSANFRSQALIVDWVNQVFARLFPGQEDQSLGAIPYSASVPALSAVPGQDVQLHGFLGRDDLAERDRVCQLVAQELAHADDRSVAVLVRSRAHLTRITEGLREAGIAYRAVEIDKLADRPAVLDLLALARALVHAGDATAWLSLLHAPFIGLHEADLLRLAEVAGDGCIPLALSAGATQQLRGDGRARLERCWPILEAALYTAGAQGMRQRVEAAWLALGGPATLDAPSDLDDAEAFLRLLEDLESGGDVDDVNDLVHMLDEQFASGRADTRSQVQVMTIHKAKGLEFDSVILPGLGKTSGRPEKRLLRWQEIVRHDSDDDLLLAPLAPHGEDRDPLQAFLAQLEGERNALELGRLLYVATTRARHRLHLLGHANAPEGKPARPAAGSMLALLWPQLQDRFIASAAKAQPSAGPAAQPPPEVTLQRLAGSWVPPEAPRLPVRVQTPQVPAAGGNEGIEFEWAGETARLTGVVVHEWLQGIAGEGPEQWSAERIDAQRPQIMTALRERGVPEARVEEAGRRALRALVQTLGDRRGRWILSTEHPFHCSELALSGVRDGRVINVVVDRVIEDAQGTLWVIDYKTGEHLGAGLDEFLDRERERYRDQLARYAEIVGQWRPGARVRAALYFPLMGVWCEMD